MPTVIGYFHRDEHGRQQHAGVKAHALLAAILLLSALPLAWCGPEQPPQKPLVAVGDIHGDFDHFLVILQRVGLVDAQKHWTGGTTTLVQVGDLLDRGPKEREVMDLLMSLEPAARSSGGDVVVLLGNHEVMNILGDLRYVTPAEYASFTDNNSENRRRSAYKQYVTWYKNHSAIIAQVPPGTFPDPSEPAWTMLHVLGFVEHRQAFAPDGRYGSWLRKHSAVARIGDTVFLHGGIHPRFSSMTLDAINAQIRDEIRSFDEARESLIQSGVILPFFTLSEIGAAAHGQLNILGKSGDKDERQIKQLQSLLAINSWLCVSPDGPLWFRGYAQWSDDEGAPALQTVLQKYDAAHVVVGHTPQTTGRIRSRFDGKVFLIDTGMLDTYYPFGRASALKIVENRTKFVAEYTDSEEVLIPGKVSSQASLPANDGEDEDEHIAVVSTRAYASHAVSRRSNP